MFGVDELGMDLGTSTLHIVVRGKGIVLSEPAYVAYDRQTRNVVAVGEEARRMYGRTPAGLIVERPLRDGRIRSFDLVSKMVNQSLVGLGAKRYEDDVKGDGIQLVNVASVYGSMCVGVRCVREECRRKD